MRSWETASKFPLLLALDFQADLQLLYSRVSQPRNNVIGSAFSRNYNREVEPFT